MPGNACKRGSAGAGDRCVGFWVQLNVYEPYQGHVGFPAECTLWARVLHDSFKGKYGLQKYIEGYV